MILRDKPLGKTPLDVINELRLSDARYQNVRLGYAGRLDPMAEGLLLVLEGEENADRKQYERLPKSYEYDVVFGVSSDTYDTLGIPIHHNIPSTDEIMPQIRSYVSCATGARKQPYPPYSAARVNGKPLYWWARAGKLDMIDIPVKTIEISSIEIISKSTIRLSELVTEAIRRTTLVTGEFRQDAIARSWDALLQTSDHDADLPIVRFSANVSSGTYIRSLAHEMGSRMGCGAIAYRIIRTRIGQWSL